MAQLVHMDARLDTLSDELCQVNTRIGHIVRRQAVMGGYTVASSLEEPEDESDGSNIADDAEDDDDGDRISALKSYCKMLCMLLCMTLCMT